MYDGEYAWIEDESSMLPYLTPLIAASPLSLSISLSRSHHHHQQSQSPQHSTSNPLPLPPRHGTGTMHFANGDVYQGEWKQDWMHGQGCYTWGKSVMDVGGSGAILHDVGDTFTGEFEENEPSNGTMIRNSKGEELSGRFVGGQLEGYGVVKVKEQDDDDDGFVVRFEGDLHNGLYHGSGTEYGADGSKYQGRFIRGVRHGLGVETSSNGDVTYGEWKMGVLQGWVKIEFANGDFYHGYFDKEMKAPGRLVHADGSVMLYTRDFKYSGTCNNKLQPDGVGGEALYSNGNFYKGGWKDGVPHGEGCLYKCSAVIGGSGGVHGDGDISQFGESFSGLWNEGQFEGKGVYETADGSVKYEGSWKDGKRHGFGYWKTMDIVYEGEWDDDTYHGQGKLIWNRDTYAANNEEDGNNNNGNNSSSNKGNGFDMFGSNSNNNNKQKKIKRKAGDSFEGVFNHGRMLNGTLTGKSDVGLEYTYTGGFEGGLYSGKGSLKKQMEQGGEQKYIGEFRDGSFHGEGVLHMSNGDVYHGVFVAGLLSGMGRASYANGDEYSGKFSGGHPHGYGMLKLQNGGSYNGEFSNGRYDGEGTLTFASGQSYCGSFRLGHYHGVGVFRGNHIVYSGEFRKGLQHGQGSQRDSEGRLVYEGSFEDGIKQGKGIGTGKGFTISATYNADQPHGLAFCCYDGDDGVLQLEHWHHGIRVFKLCQLRLTRADLPSATCLQVQSPDEVSLVSPENDLGRQSNSSAFVTFHRKGNVDCNEIFKGELNGEIILRGSLEKRQPSGRVRVWQKRWFVLFPTVLLYFRNPPKQIDIDTMKHFDGRFFVNDMFRVDTGLRDANAFPFQVGLRGNRTLDLAVADYATRNEWVSALNHVIERMGHRRTNLQLAMFACQHDWEKFISSRDRLATSSSSQGNALNEIIDLSGRNVWSLPERMLSPSDSNNINNSSSGGIKSNNNNISTNEVISTAAAASTSNINNMNNNNHNNNNNENDNNNNNSNDPPDFAALAESFSVLKERAEFCAKLTDDDINPTLIKS